MSHQRIFAVVLAFFLSTSFQPTLGIYPLVVGPDVDLEMVADIELLSAGLKGNACGIALFAHHDLRIWTSATLVGENLVLTSARSFYPFGIKYSGSSGLGYLPKEAKGVFIFNPFIVDVLRDKICGFLEQKVTYKSIITYLSKEAIDYGEIQGSVCCHWDGNDAPLFDVAVHSVRRPYPSVSHVAICDEGDIKEFVRGKTLDAFYYGFGGGLTKPGTGWFRRAGLLPGYMTNGPHLRVPFSSPEKLLGTDYDKIKALKTSRTYFGLMGPGDEGGPLLVNGRLFGIGQGIAIPRTVPNHMALANTWMVRGITVKDYPAFLNAAGSMITPVCLPKTRELIFRVARTLIK